MNSSPNSTVESSKEELQNLSAAAVEAYNVVPSLISQNVYICCGDQAGFDCSFSHEQWPWIFFINYVNDSRNTYKANAGKNITNDVEQALKLFQNKVFSCEYKYDGQRAQIHKFADGSVCVFSRNGDETTSRFPDLKDIIRESCRPDAVAFILDAELRTLLQLTGRMAASLCPFKNHLREGKAAKMPQLHWIAKRLLSFPLWHRRKHFRDLFLNERSGFVQYAKEITVEAEDACSTNEATLTKMSSFLETAFLSSCEGNMVKSLDVDAGYSPSNRADTWLKVKRDYVEGLNDSLDLVPIGAWHGIGRKEGWYSPFLMACYNHDTEEFQSVCHIISGFSDSL